MRPLVLIAAGRAVVEKLCTPPRWPLRCLARGPTTGRPA